MVEKYISVAESKNDMKSLRSMLKAKKELERQRARIKYNMKMYLVKISSLLMLMNKYNESRVFLYSLYYLPS